MVSKQYVEIILLFAFVICISLALLFNILKGFQESYEHLQEGFDPLLVERSQRPRYTSYEDDIQCKFTQTGFDVEKGQISTLQGSLNTILEE